MLLDVVDDAIPYKTLHEQPIQSPLFRVDSPSFVSLPTFEGLLGDKLTAFAPRTIGIPYGVDKSQEIIKQLFDISVLFDVSKNFDEVDYAYRKTFVQANRYRGSKFTIEETLEDTFQTSYLLSMLDLRGAEENEETRELRMGMEKIPNFLLNTKFSKPEAKEAAAKAALITLLIRGDSGINDFSELQYPHEDIDKIRTLEIVGEYNKFNRLKGASPAAFYYWWLISKFTSDESFEV